MKTIEEFLDEIAIRKGLSKWLEFVFEYKDGKITTGYFLDTLQDAMQEYAKQCCDEQIKACANHTLAEVFTKEECLSTPNVAENK